jgi:hypothetical protein
MAAALAAAALAFVAMVAPAPADADADAIRSVDLRHARAVQIVGARPDDAAGADAGAAGDVNGDRLADVLVSAPGADAPGRKDAGGVYVVFGRRTTQARSRVAVPAPAQGFRILGPAAGARLKRAVAAGDINGDGLADVLVGALDEHRSAGAAYVVFGKRDGATVDLAHLGVGGIRISSTVSSVQLGYGLAGARDVNGDGRSDIVVSGAPGATGKTNAYVIFGGAPAGELHVPDLGAAGYVLHNAGGKVSLAADMNGDGRAEIVTAAALTKRHPDLAHVTFGRPGTDPVDVDALGLGGFSITDPSAEQTGPVDVTGGGDVDGDGRGDVVVGSGLSITRSGKAIKMVPNRMAVVFGAPMADAVSLAAPSPRLLTIQVPARPDPYLRVDHGRVTNGFDLSATSVSLVGDLDGDGLTDIAFNGATTSRGRKDAGSAWVVRSRGTAGPLRLARLGADAVRIDGAYAGDQLRTVTPVGGDFDGDGQSDLILGAASATRNSRPHAGIAWIVSGVRP